MSSNYSTPLLTSLPLLSRGKVRDIYTLTPITLLLITTDRLSAYDVTLSTPLPNKGPLLTLLTAHWSRVLTAAIPDLRTHFLTLSLPPQIPSDQRETYLGRSMQVTKLTPFKIEAIVRSHITREAWDSYLLDSTVCGIPFPPGLQEGQPFPDGPIYTPSTKATHPGEHDEDISEAVAAQIIGSTNHARRIKDLSLRIYAVASAYALERGLILADTKFEFGLDEGTGEVVLMDEILTPESSRFWKVEGWRVGARGQVGVDKQFLRDWLKESGGAGKEGVELPEEVVRKTGAMYEEAFRILVQKGVEEVMGELSADAGGEVGV
ncbi:MAG: hypothetical protein Q9184_005851 [Pyrenodesmia sp. 2 TL-2023]